MKIYLSKDECKTLRDALYANRQVLEKQLKEDKTLSHRVIEVAEEGIDNFNKLILYFSKLIEEAGE